MLPNRQDQGKDSDSKPACTFPRVASSIKTAPRRNRAGLHYLFFCPSNLVRRGSTRRKIPSRLIHNRRSLGGQQPGYPIVGRFHANLLGFVRISVPPPAAGSLFHPV